MKELFLLFIFRTQNTTNDDISSYHNNVMHKINSPTLRFICPSPASFFCVHNFRLLLHICTQVFQAEFHNVFTSLLM